MTKFWEFLFFCIILGIGFCLIFGCFVKVSKLKSKENNKSEQFEKQIWLPQLP